MAEKTILVCDTCGRPAVETVTIKLGRGNFVKDQCGTHVNELIAGARRPRPGRPKAVMATRTAASAAPKKRGRPRKATKAKAIKAKPKPRAKT